MLNSTYHPSIEWTNLPALTAENASTVNVICSSNTVTRIQHGALHFQVSSPSPVYGSGTGGKGSSKRLVLHAFTPNLNGT